LTFIFDGIVVFDTHFLLSCPKVFVTFETEQAQRAALAELKVSVLAARMNFDMPREERFRFSNVIYCIVVGPHYTVTFLRLFSCTYLMYLLCGSFIFLQHNASVWRSMRRLNPERSCGANLTRLHFSGA
jgi:hypothetical protein